MAKASDYLVVETEKGKAPKYHLQVKVNGKPDHRLMGGAWAALHEGYRGNVYEGPDKEAALTKLKALYKQEKMDLPSEGKSGAMISAVNKRKMQAIHDTACELGAECDQSDDDDEVPSAKSIVEAFSAIKCLQGMNYTASEEGWDISDAASALAQVAHIASHEASSNEPDDVAQLANVMRELLKFIASEVDEMEAAMADEPESEPETAGYTQPMAKVARFTEKPLTLTYLKSLHPSHTEQWFADVIAVKSIGQDDIRGYSMLWGDPQIVDVELEYFTKSTNFWDQTLATPKPLTWDHALDKTLKATPVIGSIVEFGDDEIGRWYNAQLKRNHLYRNAIDQLISQKAVGTSSDSAPQYVVREATGKSTWLKEWPWFASALTTTPAEPRMLDVGSPYWKSIGVQIDAPDGAGLDSQIKQALREYEYLSLGR